MMTVMTLSAFRDFSTLRYFSAFRYFSTLRYFSTPQYFCYTMIFDFTIILQYCDDCCRILIAVHCDSLAKVELINPDGGALCFAREDGGGYYCIFSSASFFAPQNYFPSSHLPPETLNVPPFPHFFPR